MKRRILGSVQSVLSKLTEDLSSNTDSGKAQVDPKKEPNPFGDFRQIIVKEDMYALSFVAMTKKAMKEHSISAKVNARNLYTVFWIMGMECTTIAVLIKS